MPIIQPTLNKHGNFLSEILERKRRTEEGGTQSKIQQILYQLSPKPLIYQTIWNCGYRLISFMKHSINCCILYLELWSLWWSHFSREFRSNLMLFLGLTQWIIVGAQLWTGFYEIWQQSSSLTSIHGFFIRAKPQKESISLSFLCWCAFPGMTPALWLAPLCYKTTSAGTSLSPWIILCEKRAFLYLETWAVSDSFCSHCDLWSTSAFVHVGSWATLYQFDICRMKTECPRAVVRGLCAYITNFQ